MGDERKTLRLDGDGRDVTDSPGLWDDDDTIWHAPFAYADDAPKVAGRYWLQSKASPEHETVWNITEDDIANPPAWFRLNRFAGPLIKPKGGDDGRQVVDVHQGTGGCR